MARPVHFEILGDDPEELGAFYKAVFGWEVNTWGGGEQTYWLLTTGSDEEPGINGSLMARHFDQAVINTVTVDALAEAIAKVEAAGGRKVHGPNEIPEVGTHAYCEDPEGNLFGIMQPATAA